MYDIFRPVLYLIIELVILTLNKRKAIIHFHFEQIYLNIKQNNLISILMLMKFWKHIQIKIIKEKMFYSGFLVLPNFFVYIWQLLFVCVSLLNSYLPLFCFDYF